jgi:DNA-binding PadR family transcriptional regulator
MIDDIASISGTVLGPGTLYGALGRLAQSGWIEPLPSATRRQPYRITEEGRQVLRAHLEFMERFVESGFQRLNISNGR